MAFILRQAPRRGQRSGRATRRGGSDVHFVPARPGTGRGVGLVLAFAYIVLAAQFESFVHPLTIMVSMFLAIPFGIVTLLVLGKTLNIYSIMGLFLLMGVVKKNAILQVDCTNVLRGRGLGRGEAQMQADRARLPTRPHD
jgi:HAE1 family hydrophobic/amphiphilic exporter-1